MSLRGGRTEESQSQKARTPITSEPTPYSTTCHFEVAKTNNQPASAISAGNGYKGIRNDGRQPPGRPLR